MSMQRNRSLIPVVAAALAMIVLTAVVQGFWTERWRPAVSDQLRAFAAALARIPMTLGDWDGQMREMADPRTLEAAGAIGHLNRTYRNPRTGAAVSVFLLCGPSRSVAIHTPDACYPGAGFRQEGKPQTVPLKYTTASGTEQMAELTTVIFIKEDAAGTQRLRLFWGWNAQGKWEAPEWPRVRFGGRTALNKLYLICPEPTEAPLEQSPAWQFAPLFLSATDAQLFPATSPKVESR